MENVRNHRDIKLVTSDRQRKKFASEPNYHTTKRISKDLLIMEMKKAEVKMNKAIYLGQTILVKQSCMNFGMIILNLEIWR